MKRMLSLTVAVVLAAAALGCGPKVMVPPKIDLTQHEVVGMIEFKSTNEGELGPQATGKFMEAARRDQGMIRIVTLGSQAEVLRSVGHSKLDQAAFKAIGEKHQVATIIAGELAISDVRPDITITPGLGYMSFAAEVDAALTVQLVETMTGASIWNGSSSATKRVSHVSIFGREHFAFDAEDPDEAYGDLIDELVEETSRDFRVTWERK